MIAIPKTAIIDVAALTPFLPCFKYSFSQCVYLIFDPITQLYRKEPIMGIPDSGQ